MLDLTTFTANDGTVYNVDGKLNCLTANLIYGIYCQKCKRIMCVGETGTTMYESTANHLSSLRKQRKEVVPLHFNQQDHDISDFKTIDIEKIKKSWIYRPEKEMFWMNKIGTLHKQGLNKQGC